MEVYDGAITHVPQHLVCDLSRTGLGPPVFRIEIPADVRQSVGSGESEHLGIDPAVWRAEERRHLAGCSSNRCSGLLQLTTDRRFIGACKVAMRLCVIADEMALGGDTLEHIRPLLGALADREEACACTMFA